MQRRAMLLSLSALALAGCEAIKGPDLEDSFKPASDNGAKAPPVAALLAASEAEVTHFFGSPEWEGFRNLVAGARGIFIAPATTTGGFLVGAQFGRGVILARHGIDWSDPVFVRLTNYSVGFQAGAAKSAVLMLILTNAAIEQFIAGTSKVSTAGGVALGDWGVGALGAGGMSGGAQVLTAQTSSGLFAGTGLGSAQMRLDPALNAQAYGAGFSPRAVLAGRGGRLRDATALRASLSRATRAAWG